ncbi:MAG: WYL domain-containing protein [Bacteroidaceae bacterium]|nr:WYL domain-containing protein [Bacteroidaceae bacterium]
MKPSGIFKQYIWLINTINRSGKITLQELNNRWIRTEMSGGMPMNRITFNRHRIAIEEMFDISIECQRKGGYFYYIENKEVFTDNNLQQWMLDSLSISNMLMESSTLKQRIILENIPLGKEYLQPIINAMKLNRKLQMTYRKFDQSTGYTITIEPYAIKVFRQRWYLLANDYKRKHPSIYALDRIEFLEETNEAFTFPSDFDTELFFKDSFGVLCTDDAPQRIVIRAYPPLNHYLRTLPLHHSQKEMGCTPGYTDFEFYLRPTFDFRQELLSQAHEAEVLEPQSLRQEMKELLVRMIERYR